MAGTNEHSEEERSERREERDAVGMPAKQTLGYLYHPVHSTGGLQHARTGHGGDDDIDDIGGWVAWLEVKTKDQYSQAYTGDGTKCQRAVARLPKERAGQPTARQSLVNSYLILYYIVVIIFGSDI